MASFTLSQAPWADGTTVGVYPAVSVPAGSDAPSGSTVTTGTVSGGSVAFTGLTERVRYYAYAGGQGVRFLVPRLSPSAGDRSRIEELETGLDAAAGDIAQRGVNLGVSLPPNADVDLTGATDSSAAIQARIDALPARGGALIVPQGTHIKHATKLDFTAKASARIVHEGGAYGGAEANMAWLEYTGTTRGIDARSTYGFQMQGVYYTGYSLAAGAPLVDLDALPADNDTAAFSIRDCTLRGTNNGTGILVSLTNAQSGTLSHTFFMGAARAIRGTQAGHPTDYSNSITVNDRCLFQYQASAPILNPFQCWTIEDCVFQQLQAASGPAGAVEVESGHQVMGMRYEGNSHQDTNGLGDWLTLRGSGFHIAGNFWHTGARFIVFIGACDGVALIGNEIGESGGGASVAAVDFGSTGVTNFEDVGNAWSSANAAQMVGKVNTDLGGFLANSDGHTTASAGSAWPSANRALFVRYVPKVTHTVSGVAFHCVTLDAGNPAVDVAVLDSSRNRLASSGSTTGVVNSTGIKYVPFTSPVVLRKGQVYYVGMAVASTTAAVAFMANFSSGTTAEIISNATPTLLQGFRDASLPIANPVGGLTSNASVPVMALRTA